MTTLTNTPRADHYVIHSIQFAFSWPESKVSHLISNKATGNSSIYFFDERLFPYRVRKPGLEVYTGFMAKNGGNK